MRRPDARGSMEAGLAEEVEGGEGETIRQRRITHMLCARDEKMKGLKLIGSTQAVLGFEGVYLVRGTQLAGQADVFCVLREVLLQTNNLDMTPYRSITSKIYDCSSVKKYEMMKVIYYICTRNSSYEMLRIAACSKVVPPPLARPLSLERPERLV